MIFLNITYNTHVNKMVMKKQYALGLALAAMALVSCGSNEKEFDATGIFEATEVIVSAEQNGALLHLDVNEGDRIEQGAQVGLIDTVQLYLKARQIGATRLVYATQRPDAEKQMAATRQQLAKAREEYDRFAGLVREGAANRKNLDDAKSQVQVLERQLEALRSSLNNSTSSLNAQMSTADIQKLQVADQLRKCHVVSPISGTVLEKYMEQGEYAVTGKPIFKIADTDRMFLRAYITSAQLKSVKIGQSVKVFADYGGNGKTVYQGKVVWISSKSEFTPKTVLTDDERANLVYAVKIAVNNDGYIKIGMYGEAKF